MFSGLDGVEIGDTLITHENGGANAAEPLPPLAVEQPTFFKSRELRLYHMNRVSSEVSTIS